MNHFDQKKEPIAIVGIGCRLPGDVNSPKEFWEALKSGFNGIVDVPSDRWSNEEFYDPNPDKAGKIKQKKGGFIKDIDKFDAEFFNIFPKTAERIDPQQRLLLEATYNAMEDAGMKLENFKGSNTAVYMGVFMNDYWDIQASQAQRNHVSPHVPMGVSLTSIANRLSWQYDLKGPSMTLDTACSSSLVGVHLACNAIWNGESDYALAGGVNLIIRPESSLMMSKGNFLCPDGYCKSFDASGNGYVRSEGVGVIMLKPLSKAIADGDDVYATIKGTAVNSDGYTEDGFTVPNPTAQASMLHQAYKNAGVDPSTVGFVEAHGTGTKVGDPIETSAFSQVFAENRDTNNPLIIGSVKSNMGHLEAAAGIAGIIKLALSIKNRQIPQNLHFNNPNPAIKFDEWKLKVPTQLMDWPSEKVIGGINSFGAGGTNAHAVLEAYEPKSNKVERDESVSHEPDISLYAISAQNTSALRKMAEAHIEFLNATTESLQNICYSLGQTRSNLTHRLTIAVASKEDLIEALEAYLNDESRPGMVVAEDQGIKPKVGFIFSGQGPQWFAMGRQLINSEPIFQDVINRIDKILSKLADWSLLEEISKSEEDSRISETRIAQPAIMAIQIGLMELWKSVGVVPEGVVGHSIGEVAAAYTSGALTLEQAVDVIFNRSRGQDKATGKGKMLAAALTVEEARKEIVGVEHCVSIAAINGPTMLTFSGDVAPLEEIAARLDSRDIFHRFLRVNVPFHSHYMEPLKDELISDLRHIVPSKANKSLYSTVTGKQEDGTHLVSEYWYSNVRESVYFTDAVSAMIQDGFNTFVEIAPHPVLASGVVDLLKNAKVDGALVASIRRKEAEKQVFMQNLGLLYTLNYPINWAKACPGATHKVEVPTYTWQKEVFWFETEEHKAKRIGTKIHPMLNGVVDSNVDKGNFIWDIQLDKNEEPYILDHQVDDVIIFPGTGHLEIATAAGKASFADNFGFLEDIRFENALFLPDDGEMPHVRLEISSLEGDYVISTKPRNQEDAEWTQHSRGKINALGDQFYSEAANLEEVIARVNRRMPIVPLYNELKGAGLLYGDAFRAITGLWTSKDEVLSEVTLHESIEYGVERYNIHPAVLDACLHTIFAAKKNEQDAKRGIYLPVGIDRFKVFAKPGKKVFTHVTVTEASDAYVCGDFQVFNTDGTLVAEIQGFKGKYIEGSRGESKHEIYKPCFEYQWINPEEAFVAPEKATGKYIIFADQSELYKSIATQLEVAGAEIVEVHAGTSFEKQNNNNYSINPLLQEDFSALFKHVGDFSQIVYLWANDLSTDASDSLEVFSKAQEDFCMRTLNLLRTAGGLDLTNNLWLVTRGAEKVTANDTSIELAQAAIYGMGRVSKNEFPLLPVRIADLSVNATSEETKQLVSAILTPQESKEEDTEFAFRGEDVLLRRLVAVDGETVDSRAATKQKASGTPYRAEVQENGMLDSLALRAFNTEAPKEGEVQIAVRAAGLNFKDVVNGMGILSEEAVAGGVAGSALGLECSGVITALGKNVTDLKVGDEVIAWAANCLAGLTTAPAHCVVKKPTNISHELASSLSVVFLTAHYGLNHLAHMEKGDKVLIHAATGGLGIAAIQLAQLAGAEIYATAGSDEKREYLRELGIKNIYNSRTLEFADQIMADTNGKGVDIVLNSLTGKAITQSFKCLAPFGTFVEVGKADIYDNSKLPLKRFGENISFHVVDLDRLMAQKKKLAKRLYAEVTSLFSEEKVTGHPLQLFPVAEAGAALKYLSKVGHIGKVVVTMGDELVDVMPPHELQFKNNAAYVISGGASGFGLQVAKWMAENGAGELILLSRSGAKSDYDRKVIAYMESLNVKVQLPKVDITDETALKSIFDSVAFPIKGLVHSAAVLDDCTMPNLDADRFMRVYNPKAMGAWALHKASLDHQMDFFLSFSSISAVFGLPGQANYSSANNFLDRLATYRQSLGMAGNSVNLGVLGEYAGMSKDGGQVIDVLEAQGWTMLTLKQIRETFSKIILQRSTQRMVANLDFKRFKDFFPQLATDNRFAELMNSDASDSAGAGGSLKDQVLATSADTQAEFLQEQLRNALAKILGTSPDKIDIPTPMSKMGLDSLMQNQVRNWISQKLEVNYPLMKIAKGPSLIELANDLLLGFANEAQESTSNAPEVATDISGIEETEDLEILGDKWFVHRKREDNANMRIFCFHPVGAGASMYNHFMYELNPEIDVFAVQLPGRENRKDEANITEFFDVIDALERQILPYLDKPFAFYGHSFGGILAYELQHRLREKHNLHPEHFFVSGTISAHLTPTWRNDRDTIHETADETNSEAKLMGLMSYIDDENFVRQILPIMRKDMELIMGYEYEDKKNFEWPITAFAAKEDEVVLPEEMKPWARHTDNNFKMHTLNGDHWFLSRNKDFIMETLEKSLIKELV
ncbi:type I polyketide synthase [Saccharicrinis aurantiacus]|uniref:type I polyketide synthase n=1 Tax=Saccharicrinis aurantiacus TaxID=1849719 RepID=UPI00249347E5|nr:type I polyketide synthase [Saccharicrinis aurantiacus]